MAGCRGAAVMPGPAASFLLAVELLLGVGLSLCEKGVDVGVLVGQDGLDDVVEESIDVLRALLGLADRASGPRSRR